MTIVSKRKALRILVDNSLLLSPEIKQKLQATIDNLPEEDIDAMGKFLALERQKQKEIDQQTIALMKQKYPQLFAEVFSM
ncbi:hypothetical protein ACFL2B_01120 [Patescibacteria group bacterium]